MNQNSIKIENKIKIYSFKQKWSLEEHLTKFVIIISNTEIKYIKIPNHWVLNCKMIEFLKT